ncbi:hypothetical protein ID866_10414, partial [Astraeus odoratus]
MAPLAQQVSSFSPSSTSSANPNTISPNPSNPGRPRGRYTNKYNRFSADNRNTPSAVAAHFVDSSFERYNACGPSRILSPSPVPSALQVKVPIPPPPPPPPSLPPPQMAPKSSHPLPIRAGQRLPPHLQPDLCLKWIMGICRTMPCPYSHTLDPSICRDWVRGNCNWPACRYSHDLTSYKISVAESCKSAISEAPKPTVSATGKPSVSEAPKPSVSEARKPSVSEVPKPPVPEVPKPSVLEACKPAVLEAPQPSVSAARKPAVPEAPKPSVSEARKPSVLNARKPSVSEAPKSFVSEVPKPAVPKTCASETRNSVCETRKPSAASVPKSSVLQSRKPSVCDVPKSSVSEPRKSCVVEACKYPPRKQDPYAAAKGPMTLVDRAKCEALVKQVETPRLPEPLFATSVADHIKVKLDWGFVVQEVVTGFESRWVLLGNVKPGIPKGAIAELLAKYGQMDSLVVTEPSPTKKSLTAKAQFSSPADAMKAATELNGCEFGGRPLTAKVSINNSIGGTTILDDTEVYAVWQLPYRTGYAGYATLKEAKAAMEAAASSPMGDSLVTADLYDGLPAVGAYNVIFRYLPAQTTEKDLRKFGDAESIMLERPNYTSLERVTQTIRTIMENYGTLITFEVMPPPYKDGLVKAWVRFSTVTEARAVQENLDKQSFLFLGRTPLFVRHVVSISHTFPYPVYKKLQDELGWLRRSWSQRYGPGITLTERGNIKGIGDGPVIIKLSCEDSTLLSHLKYEFEQLIRGEAVMFDKKPIWDDFLISSAGYAFIQQLHRQYPGLEIQLHRSRRVVNVHGSIVRRHQAKQEIVRKIVEIRSQQLWDIPLPGKMLGLFVSEDLGKLQDNLGTENCYLNYVKRALIVRGNEQTFRIACLAVQEAQDRQGVQACSPDVTCPVCFNEAVVPVSLACGHRWCRSCLMGYLAAAVDN